MAADHCSSSSTFFFGLEGDHTNQQPMNAQLNSNLAPTSLMMMNVPQLVPPASQVLAIERHPVCSKKQSRQPAIADQEIVEVITLSPTTLATKNRYVCEVCNKVFQCDQNLKLHRRVHKLPWLHKPKIRNDLGVRKVYLCPEPTCPRHDPCNALTDVSGIRKHYLRKHREKNFKCEKCGRLYGIKSDYRAHSETCGIKDYKCSCRNTFSRRDSFIKHKKTCHAVAQERSVRTSQTLCDNNSNCDIDLGDLPLQDQSGPQISSIENQTYPKPLPSTTCGSLTFPQLNSQVPSTYHQAHPFPSTTPVLNQLIGFQTNSRPTMDFNCHMPTTAWCIPSSDQQNQQEFQRQLNDGFPGNLINKNDGVDPQKEVNLYMNTILGNGGSYESNECSSLFSSGGIISNHSGSSHSASAVNNFNVAPNFHLSATELVQMTGVVGSMFSNNNASNMLRGCSPTVVGDYTGLNSINGGISFSFSSPHFSVTNTNGGTVSDHSGSLHFAPAMNNLNITPNPHLYAAELRQNPALLVGSTSNNNGDVSIPVSNPCFSVADTTGDWTNQNENLNASTSSGGDNGSELQQHPPMQNLDVDFDFDILDDLLLTQGFLAVGSEEMVRSISNDEQQSNFRRANFL